MLTSNLRTPFSASRKPWLAGILITLLVAAGAFRTQYRMALVSGNSMLPTLTPGQILVVDRRAYDLSEPDRGDLVVAWCPWGLVVKRVVGLPGERVRLKQGELFINGHRLPEEHLIEPGSLDVEEGKLRPGDFATLGDNRAVSPAAAIHPIVTKADIVGKVVWAFGKKIR